MEDDQEQTPRDGQEVRPSRLEPTSHRQHRQHPGGVVHYWNDSWEPVATVPHKMPFSDMA